ncbi:MAG: NUDIX domain-containing protein [Candidatus Woesearchaeota archaeon]|nr:MAG: NUDIX domain-containing protein [Candidatus Woesearchaeota archaeon]
MSEEKLEVIDDNFNVIGVASREEVIKNNLKHKTSLIIVKNSKNELYVRQRSRKKKIFPLKWVVSAGGGVNLGETFESAARRELKEELGIEASLKYLYDFDYESTGNNYKAKVYLATYDGEITVNKEECEQGKWMSKEEVRELIDKDLLCPDTAIFMQKYFELF